MDDDLGPLPVWGWLVVGVAALVVWRYVRRARPPASSAAAPPALGVSVPYGASPGGVFLLPNGSGGSAVPVAPSSPIVGTGGGNAIDQHGNVSSTWGDQLAAAFNRGAPAGFVPTTATGPQPGENPAQVHPAMLAAGPGGTPVPVYGNVWLTNPAQAGQDLGAVFSGLAGLPRG